MANAQRKRKARKRLVMASFLSTQESTEPVNWLGATLSEMELLEDFERELPQLSAGSRQGLRTWRHRDVEQILFGQIDRRGCSNDVISSHANHCSSSQCGTQQAMRFNGAACSGCSSDPRFAEIEADGLRCGVSRGDNRNWSNTGCSEQTSQFGRNSERATSAG